MAMGQMLKGEKERMLLAPSNGVMTYLQRV
jgi:hypothetical protein